MPGRAGPVAGGPTRSGACDYGTVALALPAVAVPIVGAPGTVVPVVGEGTVKSHVTNILGKLHLVDRTQAAIFAWREGVMRKPPEG